MKWLQPQTLLLPRWCRNFLFLEFYQITSTLGANLVSHMTLSPINHPNTPHPVCVPLTGEGATRTTGSGYLRPQTVEAAS